jgi:uncharacterized Zn-binding protein involved in type VI secretion
VSVDFTVCQLQTPGTPPVPHIGGIITGPGATTVKIGGFPAALEDDEVPCVGPTDKLVKVAKTVKICNKAPARKGDKTAHRAEIKSGCPTVNIDDTIQGAALKKAGAPLVQICTDPNAPEMV